MAWMAAAGMCSCSTGSSSSSDARLLMLLQDQAACLRRRHGALQLMCKSHDVHLHDHEQPQGRNIEPLQAGDCHVAACSQRSSR